MRYVSKATTALGASLGAAAGAAQCHGTAPSRGRAVADPRLRAAPRVGFPLFTCCRFLLFIPFSRQVSRVCVSFLYDCLFYRTRYVSPVPCPDGASGKVVDLLLFPSQKKQRPTRDFTGCVFSEPAFFLETCQARPMRAHTCPGITWRLCGGLGASVARDLRALRLWQSSRQWHAALWSCIDAAPGCRALRRSSNTTY